MKKILTLVAFALAIPQLSYATGPHIVTGTAVTLPFAQAGAAQVVCPSTEKVVGGGFVAGDNNSWPTASYPITVGSDQGWKVTVINTGGNPQIVAYAVCTDNAAGSASLLANGVTFTGGNPGSVCFNSAGTLNCADVDFTFNGTTNAVVLAGTMTAANFTSAGVLTMGTGPTTVTNAVGKVLGPALSVTAAGAATGKNVLCVDGSNNLFASSTGTDCSN